MYKITVGSNEIYHYGILGMHWGVRRYQNYDGTRIGAGEPPVTNKSKMSDTIAGGQGGKAVGNARLAAVANPKAAENLASDSNDSEATPKKKSTGEAIFGPSIKKGKGRDDGSVAQEVTKHVLETDRAAQEAIKAVKDADPKVKQAAEKQERTQMQKAKKMSDKELRDSINRIKMEREYVSLTSKETKTGYDKAVDILQKAEPFVKVAAEVAGLILLLYKVKGAIKQSISDEDITYIFNYCVENGFDNDIIQHATNLDLDYILDYYDLTEEDLQHILDSEDELYHHGVLGMKWGVRRYQNYDGTRIGAPRNTIVGGQGGKATGNSRLAAKAPSGGLFKKDPAREIQRDIEGIGFNSKLNSAREKYLKDKGLVLPPGARSLSTGKNYDAALDKATEYWQSKGNTYSDDYDKLGKDTDAFMEKYKKGTATQKELDDLLDRGRKLDAAYEKEAKRIIELHKDDLNAATLRDLGYDEEHVNAGVEYLRKKNKQIFEYVI